MLKAPEQEVRSGECARWRVNDKVWQQKCKNEAKTSRSPSGGAELHWISFCLKGHKHETQRQLGNKIQMNPQLLLK